MFGRRRLIELERENARLQEALLDRQRYIAHLESRERDLHFGVSLEREKCSAAEKRADLAQNNFEWARVRLNQVEQERATLIASMLKAPIGALEIDRRLTPEQGSGMPKLPDALFEDIGDDAAAALGIDHDGDEVVTHG
jgi:hypothetical protein